MGGQIESGQPAPLWFTAIFVGAGLFIALIAGGVIPVDPDSIHAPRWVLGAAGMVFMIGGVMAAAGPTNPRLNDVLAGTLIACMASIATWIAFGPGEREFTGGLSLGPLSLWGESGPSTGRIAFGFSAILLWALVAFVLYRVVKQLRA